MSSETVLAHSNHSTRNWHLRLAAVRLLLGIFPAFTLNRSRLLSLKACGIRTGRATMFWGLPRLTGSGDIAGRLTVGDYCGFNDGCLFELDAPISIGNHVDVGHEVRFLTASGRKDVAPAPITVGDGVWLGARCILLGGVTVGAGSVIGAGVTVATDVPPNTLISGAKPIALPTWQ